MLKLLLRVVVGLAVIGFATPMFAPQPGKPRNPEPLARPAALCSIAGTDVRATLQLITEIMRGRGFNITKTVAEGGEAHFAKADANGEDRAIVWIEWDLRNPSRRFNVYLIAARFERFFGTTELQRVVIDSAEEQRRFGAIRTALIDEALRRG